MIETTLEPVDVCGCGDEGYLATRDLPIDLNHGVGRIYHVPVYHCRSESCSEYSVPIIVSRRLDDLAEEMEKKQILEMEFYWPRKPGTEGRAADSSASDPYSIVQAFTLRFVNREYEDARVTFVIPGQAIFLRSNLDQTEYYLLRYEPEAGHNGIWFSFSKFYSDAPIRDYEGILDGDWEDYYGKELGRLALTEVEDTFNDEFGEVSP